MTRRDKSTKNRAFGGNITMKSLLLGLIVLGGTSANAAVWQTRNSWSSSWERKYQAYVKTWDVDFFARQTTSSGRANPYYGLRTDCADTVYSFRAIFAYENGLPFVIADATGGSGTISNNMSRFDSISDPNRRIRAFLQYIYDVVSTETMYMDTYPVAMNRDAIKPGIILKTTKKNHHSWTARNILSIGVPDLIFNSTIGATSGSMLQERQSWPNPEWVFEGDKTPAGKAGFRDWRPASYIGRAESSVPGYSEEQYNIPLSKWVATATARLATTQESTGGKLQRLADNACVELTSRISAVRDGVRALAQRPNSCMNSEDYDTYSTPSRDRRFFDALVDLRRAYKNMVRNGQKIPGGLRSQMEKIFPAINSSARSEAERMGRQGVDDESMCVISYGNGNRIDLAEAKRRMFAGQMSNNPNDSLEYRWGERRGPSPLAASCPSWGVWRPNLDAAD